ncbi:MAG: hypothetical protein JSY10_25350 [Paenibacillus sp.]|nr:hypothetical protein [Paenibacillus sp.]
MQKVPLKGSFAASELAKVVSFQPFQDWVQVFSEQQKTRQNEMNVDSIDVQSIDYFGSEKIGFVKFKANVAFKETGKSAPGIVFMVSLLLLLLLKYYLFTYNKERWSGINDDYFKSKRRTR